MIINYSVMQYAAFVSCIVSYATYAASSPSKFFPAKLIRFGQTWLDLGSI